MTGHLYWNGWKSESGLCNNAKGVRGEPPMNGRFYGGLYASPGPLCKVCVRRIVAMADACKLEVAPHE